jgi:membrane dipeptidase
VLDTHVDTAQRLLFEPFDLGRRSRRGCVDIPRMRQGGLDAVFFAIWCPGTLRGAPAVQRALNLIDAVREQVRRHPRDLALAATAQEARAARRQGKIAILLGLEGGHMIAGDLAVLRTFAALGVRYLTLTHNLNTDWADSSTDKPAHHGLTRFGRTVVREMNRLGMLVDVSHASDETFWDALRASCAPVIASHSSCRALADAPRNLTDRMIRALAAKGGVVQINYELSFLSQPYRDALNRMRREFTAAIARAEKACGGNEASKIMAWNRVVGDYQRRGRLPAVAWEKIVEHIDHAVELAGPDHVGLGSDFDGATMPRGMEDCSRLAAITGALLDRGYSAGDIRKILAGNLLRVLAEAEAGSFGEAQGSK